MKLILAVALMLGGAASSGVDPRADRTRGETRTCIDPLDTQTVRVIDDRTIAYQTTVRRVWLSALPNRCAGLAPDTPVSIEQRGVQLCAGDRFRPLSGGARVPGGYCRLGPFTAYDLPPR